jgi:hypothetical protein
VPHGFSAESTASPARGQGELAAELSATVTRIAAGVVPLAVEVG